MLWIKRCCLVVLLVFCSPSALPWFAVFTFRSLGFGFRVASGDTVHTGGFLNDAACFCAMLSMLFSKDKLVSQPQPNRKPEKALCRSTPAWPVMILPRSRVRQGLEGHPEGPTPQSHGFLLNRVFVWLSLGFRVPNTTPFNPKP